MTTASLYPRPAPAERENTARLLAAADLLAPLPLATLSVTGPDAGSFLQGQVTCDVREVTANTSRLGGLLNLKGRVQISFRLLAIPDGFLMVLPVDQLAATRQRLGKYAVFSKVALGEGGWQVSGVLGAAAWKRSGPWPVDVDQVIHDAGTMRLRLPGDCRGLLLSPCTTGQEPVDPAIWQAWLTAALRAGDLLLPVTDSERFQPQELDFHVLQGVSYQKGCYLGQEIVARLYFRGQLKTRLTCLQGQVGNPDEAITLASGSALTAGGHVVGELVAAAWNGVSEVTVLALLREQADTVEATCVEGGTLSLTPLPFTR